LILRISAEENRSRRRGLDLARRFVVVVVVVVVCLRLVFDGRLDFFTRRTLVAVRGRGYRGLVVVVVVVVVGIVVAVHRRG
jgi:hypothetical protein